MMGAMNRCLALGALIALGFAGSALADDTAAAKAKCVQMSMEAGGAQATTPEQKAQLEGLVGSLCECVTAKFGAMGDDGVKMLHVMTAMTPEQARAGSADPAADKKNVAAILVADYGMSEKDAEAFYERVNPQAEQIGAQCTQDAMQKAATPAAPSK